jgi:hypothetical protein
MGSGSRESRDEQKEQFGERKKLPADDVNDIQWLFGNPLAADFLKTIQELARNQPKKPGNSQKKKKLHRMQISSCNSNATLIFSHARHKAGLAACID